MFDVGRSSSLTALPILLIRQLSVVRRQWHFSPCRNPKTERPLLPGLPASQFVFSFDVGRWMFDVGRSSSLTALPILRPAPCFPASLLPSLFFHSMLDVGCSMLDVHLL
jgi:hypothetical protein